MIETAKARIWTSEEVETEGFPENEYDSIREKNNVGICISGGGTVSMSAGIGYLRGLHQLGLLSNVRYLSGISGGAWISVPYTFLPQSHSVETFLGAELLDDANPSHLTKSKLTNLNRESLNYWITQTDILKDSLELLVHQGRGSEAYSEALGQMFLVPYGLYDKDFRKYFTLNPESLKSILDNNPGLKEDQFYLAAEDRPFLIAGATLVYPTSSNILRFKLHRKFPYIFVIAIAGHDHLYPFEYTPLYTGCVPKYPNRPLGINLGGGYLESFGFNSTTASLIGNDLVDIEYGGEATPFELCDVMGSTGAAFSVLVDQYIKEAKALFPCFNYWPIMNPTQNALFLNFADGGIIDDPAIIPLLRRKVKKIIFFCNTPLGEYLSYTDNPKKQAQSGSKGTLAPESISVDIRQLFGRGNYVWLDYLQDLQVLVDNGKFDAIVKGFQEKLNAGETVMFRDIYTVKPNSLFGLEGGYEVEILWVYKNQVANWQKDLTPEVRDLIKYPFPNYSTFFPPIGLGALFRGFSEAVKRGFESAWAYFVARLTGKPVEEGFWSKHLYDLFPKIVEMTAPETGLLSHLSYWNVVNDRNAEEFKYMLS